MTLLRRLFGKPQETDRPAAPEPVFDAPLAPDTPYFAIGDIHGCARQLELLLTQIENLTHTPQVVCLGDYIDRGEDSALVLQWLKQLNETYGDEVFRCLMGNHEEMLLQFLDAPEKAGPRWLRNGGLQTLASYKLPWASDMDPVALRDSLRDAMGDELIAWLRGLPLRFENGNTVAVHAGMDPSLPIDAQAAAVLRWGHPDFLRRVRTDGLWVVHGHTIVKQAQARDGKIAVDTGAYATGRLSAAVVDADGVSFMST